jgi:hypothetical protein
MAANLKELWQIPADERDQWTNSGQTFQSGPMSFDKLYERRTPATNARNAAKAAANKARANAAAADKAARRAIIGKKTEVPFHEAGWRLPRYHLITDNGYFVPLSEAEWTAYKAAYPTDGMIKMSIDAGSELDDATYTLRRDYYRAKAGSESLESFLRRKAIGYFPQADPELKWIGVTASQDDRYSPEYAAGLRAQAAAAIAKAAADVRAALSPERVAELVPELAKAGGTRRKSRKSKVRRSSKTRRN